MKIKERLEEILPFLMVDIMIFYGGPLFMKDMASGIILVLFLMPAGTFLCSFFCGLKKGFRILYPLLAAIAFIPEYWVFLHDWEATGFYVFMYSVNALLGMLLGWGVDEIVKRLLR